MLALGAGAALPERALVVGHQAAAVAQREGAPAGVGLGRGAGGALGQGVGVAVAVGVREVAAQVVEDEGLPGEDVSQGVAQAGLVAVVAGQLPGQPGRGLVGAGAVGEGPAGARGVGVGQGAARAAGDAPGQVGAFQLDLVVPANALPLQANPVVFTYKDLRSNLGPGGSTVSTTVYVK